ncbi:hypothetical protein K502DRAFT_298907 [Neoconidiobolus thromboides FSU 785]|nr:hypothetical protein K502DRAFT_298907 [Neoconidiobolus thromboides FSU 785]
MAQKRVNQSILQKQLSSIRDPNTERVRSSRVSKYKDSFIFSSREAAELDVNSIFDIGVEGFNSLLGLEPKLKAFEQSLFSSKIKEVDRVLLTKADNTKLDNTIELFLTLISPYFLISHTGKVLEWLIRRFRVNEFNVDAVLRCILPYHDTPSFLKMLSILNIEHDTYWSPLIGIRKSKVTFNREQFIKITLKDSQILNFMIQSATTFAKSTPNYSSFFSFYTGFMLGYLQQCSSIEEKTLNLLLPNLLNGIQHQCKDFRLTSLILFLHTASKVSFTKDMTFKFIDLLLKNEFDIHFKVTSLVKLASSQKNCFDIKNRHDLLFDWIVQQNNFDKILLPIAKEFDIETIYEYLIIQLINLVIEQSEKYELYNQLINKLINMINEVGGNMVTKVSIHLFDQLMLKQQNNNKFIGEIFQLINKKNSSIVQQIIGKKLELLVQQHGSESKEYNLALNFFILQFQHSTSLPLKETNSSLELSLIHSNRQYRIAAINKLNLCLKTQEPSIYASFYPGLIENLKDNNMELVQVTLDLLKQNPKLVKEIGAHKLWDNIKVLPNQFKLIGYELILTMEFMKDNLLLCLPYLIEGLIYDGNNQQILQLINSKLNKNLMQLSPFLIQNNINLNNQQTDFINYNINYIQQTVKNIQKSTNPIEYINQSIQLANTHTNVVTKQILLIIGVLGFQSIYDQLTVKQVKQISIDLSKCIEKFITIINFNIQETSLLNLEECITNIINYHSVNNDNNSYLITISYCINTLMKVNQDKIEIQWLSLKQEENSKQSKLAIIITTCFSLICLKSLNMFKLTLSKLVANYLIKDQLIKFICYILLIQDINYLIKSRALILLSYTIQQSKSIIDYQLLLPFILISLNNNNELIRQAAVICLDSINNLLQSYSNEKLKKSVPIFGKKEFYPIQDKSIKYLTLQSFHFLIIQLLLNKKDIIRSKIGIKQIIKRTLNINIPKSNFAIKHGLNGHSREPNNLHNVFMEFILSIIQQFEQEIPQILLLQLIEDIECKSKLKSLSVLISNLLKQLSEIEKINLTQWELLQQLLNLFTPESLKVLDNNKDRYINMMTYSLGLINLNENNQSICELVLNKITPQLFTNLSVNSQSKLLRSLMVVNCYEDNHLASLAKKVLLKLPITYESVVDTLNEIKSQITINGNNNNKKIKLSEIEGDLINNNNNLLTRPFMQMTTLLEVLDDQLETHQLIKLIPNLFSLLSLLIELPSDLIHTSINYIYQLLLSILTTIFNNNQQSTIKINENSTRIDLVVQLLRLSSSPQVHHQALLLVSAIATVHPEIVLLHVMPIFTFMGANVLQKDDNYSFFIIQQTLEKIIPPLLNSYRQSAMDEEDSNFELIYNSKPVIKVFVNALLHIPQHRRVNLFTTLINIMGSEFLYVVLATILEIYSIKYCHGHKEEANKFKEFCLEISTQFNPTIQVSVMAQLLKSLLDLPNEKVENKDYSNVRNLFPIQEATDKQLRHYKFSIMNFIKLNLNSKSFLYMLLEIEAKSKEAKQLDENYINVAESLLLIVDDLRAYLVDYSARENVNLTIKKFFKSLVAFEYDILNDTINLLSYPCLTLFLKKLLMHSSSTIRFRSMQLLESKLEKIHTQLALNEVKNFLELVPILVDLIQMEQEIQLNKQTAFNCLGQYIMCFSKHHNITESKFFSKNILPLLLSKDGLNSEDLNIFASSCVVLSYICQELDSIIIEHIPIIMPILMKQMKVSISISTDFDNSTIWMAQFLLLDALFVKLAKFMAPYLETILTLLIEFKVQLDHMEELILKDKVSSLLILLNREIEARVLLPVIFKLYTVMIEKGVECTTALFEIVSKVMLNLSADEVEKCYILLFKFYLECFDFRDSYKSIGEENILKIEEIILQGFLLLVMKLRDDMFKPIFLKLGEWACIELSNTSHGNSRLITFYHLISLLLSNLKHIFAPYFIYTMDHAIDTLDTFEVIEENNLLWKYLLKSITLSLQFDTEGIWTMDTFNKILPKLVNQMDKVTCLTLSEECLIPCFDWLCQAVSGQTSWKSLNSAILLKTRSKNINVKCMALKILRAFYVRQGEAFLPFLPETIPYLAEVMEDDDDLIVNATRDLILTMERFHGESLDQYFR